TGRQICIHGQAEKTGRAHRTGLRVARCSGEGIGAARMGDGKRDKPRREKSRWIRTRQKRESRAGTKGRPLRESCGEKQGCQEGLGDSQTRPLIDPAEPTADAILRRYLLQRFSVSSSSTRSLE